MKSFLTYWLILILLPIPLGVMAQSKGKLVHIYETPDQLLVSGRLVEVADSTVTLVRKSGNLDTIQVCCKTIFSIQPGRSLVGELGNGIINATFLTILVADRQQAESGTSLTDWNAGSAYYDALAGGVASLLMDSNARKEPIFINYSYERFRAMAPELLQLIENSQ